jgi:hypothetical protein
VRRSGGCGETLTDADAAVPGGDQGSQEPPDEQFIVERQREKLLGIHATALLIVRQA